MSDTFNLRTFVENQVEKLSTPKNLLVDKFRQTVDNMKLPFSSINTTTEQNTSIFPTANEVTYNLRLSESVSSSSVSSNLSENYLIISQSNTQNFKILNEKFSRRQAALRRYVSESNESNISRPIYHDNPPIDVHDLLNNKNSTDRSRSLIRQSTDTTCTFPIRRLLRRMESIEIPGLNGVKSIRYINDNLGKLEPNLYKKQILPNDPTYDSGQITFTLFYNQSLTSLIIKILSIDHLPYRDLNSKIFPNPFVKLTLLPDRRKKFQTKVAKHTQSIQFNEIFQFQITYEQLCKRILLLSVYDFRRSSKRNLIGTVKIDDIYSISDLTSHDITYTKNIIPGTEVSLTHLSIQDIHFSNIEKIIIIFSRGAESTRVRDRSVGEIFLTITRGNFSHR
jgi:Ca2+-dependent lipid-binding protein